MKTKNELLLEKLDWLSTELQRSDNIRNVFLADLLESITVASKRFQDTVSTRDDLVQVLDMLLKDVDYLDNSKEEA